MRTKWRVHMGNCPQSFHSIRDFSRCSDALAFMWAMNHVRHPERCWLWQGIDGWLRNDHMKERLFPAELTLRIQDFILEDNAATREAQ